MVCALVPVDGLDTTEFDEPEDLLNSKTAAAAPPATTAPPATHQPQ